MTHAKKIESVLALAAEERFSYFVRKVADFETTWGLFSDGWASAADGASRPAIPMWPEAAFASLCATGVWGGYQPKEIDLSALLEKWLPGMTKDGLLVAVFPTPEDRGVFVEPGALLAELETEAAQYEGDE